MSRARVITAVQLRRHGACSEEISRFVEMFGQRASVTKENCCRYVGGSNFAWAIINLLRGGPARNIANKVARKAQSAHSSNINSAWAIYYASVAREACRVVAGESSVEALRGVVLYQDEQRRMEAARSELYRARILAVAFCEAYNKGDGRG